MKRRVVALTFVEILICVAIILILAAIGGAIYGQTIRRGGFAGETSQLHQLGLATNLYREQYDGWPENTQTLVNAGFITKAICKSPLDTSKEGWANRYLTARGGDVSNYATLVAPFPNTYLCINDVQTLRREELEPLIAEQPNFGFFVSLTESTPRWKSDNPTGPFDGFYRRVLMDGSVQRRQHAPFKMKDSHGKMVSFESDHAWFFDPTQRWIGDLLYQLSP